MPAASADEDRLPERTLSALWQFSQLSNEQPGAGSIKQQHM